jgi:hypothetical protein
MLKHSRQFHGLFGMARCLTIREGRRISLKILVNSVLRRILGPKRRGGAGNWNKLHRTASKFVHITKYYKRDQIEKSEMGGVCSTHGRDETCIQNFSQVNRLCGLVVRVSGY